MQFLNASNCKKLLRAHQCIQYGVSPFAFGQGLTIFSTSNYMGRGNNAAIIFADARGRIKTKELQPLPDVPPRNMAVYAPVSPIAQAARASPGSQGLITLSPSFRQPMSSALARTRLGEASSVRRGSMKDLAKFPHSISSMSSLPQIRLRPDGDFTLGFDGVFD
jgi:hypothetical protein